MIALANPRPERNEFEQLLTRTTQRLNELAAQGEINGDILRGRDLEPFIAEELRKDAIDTPFNNTIQIIGGQKFPDLIAGRFYGIEVKSTTQDHWTTTGNSVLESTRVEDVERIWMMFGKLAEPIEFRCRPYEECLSEVVVTHSPRYQIDMNLPVGETIFDKIGMPYDTLRVHNPPIQPIMDYYRAHLRHGEQLWYLGSTSLIMRFWSSLEPEEKILIVVTGFVFYPEIFGGRADKYNRMAAWLVQHKSIVVPNLRDLYSSSGRKNLNLNGRAYNMSQVVYRMLMRLADIENLINSSTISSLKEAWGVENLTRANSFNTWRNIVQQHIQTSQSVIDITPLLRDFRIQNRR